MFGNNEFVDIDDHSKLLLFPLDYMKTIGKILPYFCNDSCGFFNQCNPVNIFS